MRDLPCFPCPHQAACCAYGVSLVGDEADVLRARHGTSALVWDDEENEWRTAVVDGKCIFLRDGACTIHDQPYYPKTCRGFPWLDGETGGPYLYDQSICPELPETPEE